MPKLKFKSYLITNIPERDWKKFKRWAAIMDYNNLNDAIAHQLRLAPTIDLQSSTDQLDTLRGERVGKTT